MVEQSSEAPSFEIQLKPTVLHKATPMRPTILHKATPMKPTVLRKSTPFKAAVRAPTPFKIAEPEKPKRARSKKSAANKAAVKPLPQSETMRLRSSKQTIESTEILPSKPAKRPPKTLKVRTQPSKNQRPKMTKKVEEEQPEEAISPI